MRLMRIGPGGAERPVVFDDGQRIDAPDGHRRDVMELWIDGLGRQRQDLGVA